MNCITIEGGKGVNGGGDGGGGTVCGTNSVIIPGEGGTGYAAPKPYELKTDQILGLMMLFSVVAVLIIVYFSRGRKA